MKDFWKKKRERKEKKEKKDNEKNCVGYDNRSKWKDLAVTLFGRWFKMKEKKFSILLLNYPKNKI